MNIEQQNLAQESHNKTDRLIQPPKEKNPEFYFQIENLKERQELLEQRLSAIQRDLISSYTNDLDDQAIERENDEVLERLGYNIQQELRQIYRAIKRFDAGEYGICQECHQQISSARLSALPDAELCINCRVSAPLEADI